MAEYVGIDAVTPGQKLAKPVYNKFKQVLLQEGVELDEKNIKLLKIWGVTMVYIESINENKVVFTEDDIEDAKKYVRQMFLWEPITLFEKSLFNLAIEHQIKIRNK
ncbi:MAG TPA: hypothetical protein PK887_10055 [Ignavibacteriales bacterium]|nr:hypothetical protein [Ignavibacteriales bacterium]